MVARRSCRGAASARRRGPSSRPAASSRDRLAFATQARGHASERIAGRVDVDQRHDVVRNEAAELDQDLGRLLGVVADSDRPEFVVDDRQRAPEVEACVTGGGGVRNFGHQLGQLTIDETRAPLAIADDVQRARGRGAIQEGGRNVRRLADLQAIEQEDARLVGESSASAGSPSSLRVRSRIMVT